MACETCQRVFDSIAGIDMYVGRTGSEVDFAQKMCYPEPMGLANVV